MKLKQLEDFNTKLHAIIHAEPGIKLMCDFKLDDNQKTGSVNSVYDLVDQALRKIYKAYY